MYKKTHFEKTFYFESDSFPDESYWTRAWRHHAAAERLWSFCPVRDEPRSSLWTKLWCRFGLVSVRVDEFHFRTLTFPPSGSVGNFVCPAGNEALLREGVTEPSRTEPTGSREWLRRSAIEMRRWSYFCGFLPFFCGAVERRVETVGADWLSIKNQCFYLLCLVPSVSKNVEIFWFWNRETLSPLESL